MPLTLRPKHLLLVTILSLATGADVFSNSFLVRFKRDVGKIQAHQVAQRHGFVSMGPVLGSSREFHFVSHAIPVARTRRSVLHTRRLKVDPLVREIIAFSRHSIYGGNSNLIWQIRGNMSQNGISTESVLFDLLLWELCGWRTVNIIRSSYGVVFHRNSC
ncbi:hypothetical protein WA026_013506 [Henosepilachna vigintioctopunctata]|uniref:Peptidase S8 pro-domain domain-containing protein n=1 Tax=Henosepilachna vigintioctopunctata TaxID=420089 RepID=A0AAW1V901_9CUCU